VTDYFAPDIVVEYHDNATERNPSQRTLHDWQGFLEPNENAPANALRPEWKTGEPAITIDRVLCDMEGSKMKRIRITHFRNH
jgi:hypothetical protein